MIADTGAPSAVAERVRELCRQFKLPTLAAETVGRFNEAGHADALVTLLEVMEQEAEDRRIRRVDRLRRTSTGCRPARPGRPSSTTGPRCN